MLGNRFHLALDRGGGMISNGAVHILALLGIIKEELGLTAEMKTPQLPLFSVTFLLKNRC